MRFHPDVLAAHAQFGGDLESMQKCYDWYDQRGRIATLEAELQKAREAALEEAARLIEEGFDRPGILKKQDTCAHGKFGWEDCEMCAAAAIRALSQDKEARE